MAKPLQRLCVWRKDTNILLFCTTNQYLAARPHIDDICVGNDIGPLKRDTADPYAVGALIFAPRQAKSSETSQYECRIVFKWNAKKVELLSLHYNGIQGSIYMFPSQPMYALKEIINSICVRYGCML